MVLAGNSPARVSICLTEGMMPLVFLSARIASMLSFMSPSLHTARAIWKSEKPDVLASFSRGASNDAGECRSNAFSTSMMCLILCRNQQSILVREWIFSTV